MRTTRVAILGGGMASLAAALRLTDPAAWSRRFEVTVYQMGWRLGGKGASGRNAEIADRIEEHGLHVWMGFYHEAFRLIRGVYDELVQRGLRGADEPLARWDQAFTPHELIVVAEALRARWAFWSFPFPRNDERPGEPGSGQWPRPGSYARMGQVLLRRGLDRLHRDLTPESRGATLARCARRVARLAGYVVSRDEEGLATLLDEDHALRRWLVFLEFVRVNLCGLVRDVVLGRANLDDLDEHDYRAWLARHGASRLLLESGGLRGMYDMSFAYEDGDLARPDFAAGTFLRFFARMFLGYKGAVFWKMQAGMGDVVFAPLYQVLRARGVRFEFFHRIDALQTGVDPDGRRVIDSVAMTRQAELLGREYEPLVDVNGLPCWPSEPRWDQLREANLLRSVGNLESAACAGIARPVTLVRGCDFDEVVLGISVGGLPRVAADLARVNPAFAGMLREVKTTATQAAQIWFHRSAADLGWHTQPCVLDAYGGAMNTWADMTHLVPRESWDGGLVGHIAYFCGPYCPAAYERPDEPSPAELARDSAHVRGGVEGMLRTSLAGLWPLATEPLGDAGGALRWDWLVAPETVQGSARLEHQYVRANTEPTDRYVLSARGTTRYRLRPHETGCVNLVFAGDWTRTELNYGCIEAAVQSGLEAAEALARRAAQRRDDEVLTMESGPRRESGPQEAAV